MHTPSLISSQHRSWDFINRITASEKQSEPRMIFKAYLRYANILWRDTIEMKSKSASS